MWCACRVVRQCASAAATATTTTTPRKWLPDPSLVWLPAGVRGCDVYRNAVTLDDEQRLYAELSRVLEQDGQVTYATTATLPAQQQQQQQQQQSQQHTHPVRLTYVELYGHDKPYVEAKTFVRQDKQRVPGLVWSPTLQRVLRTLPLHIRQSVCGVYNSSSNSNSNSNDGDSEATLPDMARVVEHQLPGYEMHIEPPTVGSGFVYLNLLADTVLELDDESTSRHGQVHVPARALVVVTDEVRWGFRIGEAAASPHLFARRRRVDVDVRMSVQLWKVRLGMLDARVLQDTVAKYMAAHEKKKKAAAMAKTTTTTTAATATTTTATTTATTTTTTTATTTTTDGAAAAAAPAGRLGGDLTRDDVGSGAQRGGVAAQPGDIGSDYMAYRKRFAKAHAVLQRLQATQGSADLGDDMRLYRELADATRDLDDDNNNNNNDDDSAVRGVDDVVNDGFDPNDLQGTFDRAAAKAIAYKTKLRTMDYDQTAFAHSTMPAVAQRAPLDMRGTIRDLAPHIKDGDAILASLPAERPPSPYR